MQIANRVTDCANARDARIRNADHLEDIAFLNVEIRSGGIIFHSSLPFAKAISSDRSLAGACRDLRFAPVGRDIFRATSIDSLARARTQGAHLTRFRRRR